MDQIFNVGKTADKKIAERIFVIEQKLAHSLKLQWSVKVFWWPMLPQRKYIFLPFIYIFFIVHGMAQNKTKTNTIFVSSCCKKVCIVQLSY